MRRSSPWFDYIWRFQQGVSCGYFALALQQLVAGLVPFADSRLRAKSDWPGDVLQDLVIQALVVVCSERIRSRSPVRPSGPKWRLIQPTGRVRGASHVGCRSVTEEKTQI
jgi:hypothetical protein